MSTEILARVQFALTVAFHYLFPPLSIGLGLMLVIIEGIWLKTGNELYHRMAHFWVRIFSLIFGLGVATGIVLEFEFGTNWSYYSRYVGDIFGSALAAEGVFASAAPSARFGSSSRTPGCRLRPDTKSSVKASPPAPASRISGRWSSILRRWTGFSTPLPPPG